MKKNTKKIILYLGVVIALLALFIQVSYAQKTVVEVHNKIDEKAETCYSDEKLPDFHGNGLHIRGILIYVLVTVHNKVSNN